VFVPSINEVFIVNPTESIQLPQGTDTIFVNGRKTGVDTTVYTAAYDTLINQSTVFNGNTPINDGFRPQIYNDALIIQDTTLSGFKNIGTSPPPNYTLKVFEANKPGQPSVIGKNMPYDYSIEFFPNIVDTSKADTLFFPPIPSNIIPSQEVNFKVKNLTTNQYIDFAYLTFGTLASGYSIWFIEDIEGETFRTWRVDIQYRTANTPLETQGTLDIFTTKPFSRSDIIQFNLKGASIDNAMAKADLERIKVVPNPYIATHSGEPRLLSTQTSGRGERNIRFTHVPPNAKISIFTVRGERIKTLTHEELYTGDVKWNLRTEENLDVAFGIYVFVVEVPDIGTKIGKFALIK
jgi:hypothetical protein